MDTNLKNAISAMRKDIAELEKEQKTFKPQRKTVHFTGERTTTPLNAFLTVESNRDELRLYYAAYGILRGKPFEVTENAFKPLIYDREKAYMYLNGIRSQYYTSDENLNGKHPLCKYLGKINQILYKYGYEFKNYEERQTDWGTTYKTPAPGNYAEVVCVGE
jgi:hypothetical protein